MKKFKSILCLLFVMILMFSMAGPMAFAAGNNKLTITAEEPVFNTSNGKWEAFYYNTCEGFEESDYEILVEVAVSVSGNKVTATPKLLSFKDLADYVDRSSSFASGYPKYVKSSITLPTIEVKATEPTMYNGSYISSFELASGSLSDDHEFAGRPAISVNGDTVVASAANVKIINGSGEDVTGMYYIKKTLNASRDVSSSKVSVTAKSAAPRLNAEGQWVCDGVADKYVTITLDDKDYNCAILADGVATDNGSTVTGSLKNVRVVTYVNDTEVDLTSRVKISTETSSVTKPTLTITLNAPVYDGTKYSHNFYSFAFNPDELSVGGNLASYENGDYEPSINTGDIVVRDNGATATATIARSKVTVLATANDADITAGFNIVITDGVRTKDTIHVYPNPANKENGSYVHDGFSSNVGDVAPDHWVQVVDWNISSNGSITPLKAIVWNDEGTDVTAYFNVVKHTTNYDGTTSTPSNNNNNNGGTVSEKTKLVIMAVDADKAYNGKAFTRSQAQGIKFINGTSLLSGHTIGDGLKIQYTRRSDGFTFTDYADVTKVGTYDKELVVLSTKVIVDKDGNDVTSQYDISTVDGILTIYNAGYVSPDTGDHSNIGLWIALLGVSAVAVAAAVVIVLKKNKKA